MSPPAERSPFASMKIRADVREALDSAAVDLTSPVGRRVTLSEVLSSALAVAGAHRDEWVRELRGES